MKIIILFSLISLLTSCASVFQKVEKWTGRKFHETRPNKKYFIAAWVKNINGSYETGNLPISLNGSAIHRSMVFVGHNSGWMQAFNLDDGHLIWQENDKAQYHSSPTIDDEKLYYGTSHGRVIARDTLTGKKIFEIDLGAPIESKGVISQGRLFFHLRNHQIFCLDALTGKVLWNYKRSISQITTLQKVAPPTVVKNQAYVGFADGYLVSLSLEDGQVLWEKKITTKKKFRDLDALTYFDGKNLIVTPSNDLMAIVSPAKGNIINRMGVELVNPPVEIDGTYYGGTIFGELVVFDEYYNVQKKVNLSKNPINHIVQWKDGIVLSTVNGDLYYLNSDTLELLDSYNFGHKFSSIFTRPVVNEGYLSVTSARGRLYVFR